MTDSGTSSEFWCKDSTGKLNTNNNISIGMKTPKIKVFPAGKIHAKPVISFDRIIERLDDNRDGFLLSNRDTLKKFIYDARLGKTNLGREKKKVGLARLLKYVQDLKKLDVYFKKPFVDVTEKDMERFILDLEDGVIVSAVGLPYAGETQVVIKKLIKKFYKWLEGDSLEVPRKVRWIDTSCEPLEYVSLSKDELDRVLVLMTSTTSYFFRFGFP